MKKLLSSMMLSFMLVSSFMVPSLANAHDNYGYDYRRYNNDRGFLADNPYIKKAVIGGGAGAVVGAVVSRDGRRVNGRYEGGSTGSRCRSRLRIPASEKRFPLINRGINV